MQLAKDRLDIGLFTEDAAMLDFMTQEVGLGEPEVLRVNRAVTQHRFDVDGSIVKVNVITGLETEARSGYASVLIADSQIDAPRPYLGPDGVTITRVPPGHRGVGQLGIVLRVPSLTRARHYFAETLGWEVEESTVRLGASVVLLEEDEGAPTSVQMPVLGWTYMTVQIHDCDRETATALERGATLAQPAITAGKVARFSMIADPWGNALELSQRASLTGPLPAG